MSTELANAAPAERPNRRRRLWTALTSLLLPVAALGCLMVIYWIVIEAFNVSNYLLPRPDDVLRQLWVQWPTISPNLLTTSIEAISGFALASILAVLAAMALVQWQRLEAFVFPGFIVLQTIPVIILAPVLIVTLGNGMAPKIVIAAIITFFPTVVNMIRGLRSPDPTPVELFRTMSATKVQTMLRLRLPASLPFLFASLRIAAVNSFIGAIVAEWISASSGIGYLAQIYLFQLDIDRLYAAVLASSLATMLFAAIVSALETWACPWSTRGGMADVH